MAKNVSLWGSDYTDVPALNVPQTGGGTARFTDTSPTTATDPDVYQGKIYFKADGTQSVGTGTGGGGAGSAYQDLDGYVVLDDESGLDVTTTNLNVTQNGTYTAPTGYAYTPVYVNVASSPTLQAKTNISPTTSSQTITADTGYDGLSSVQINAMPSGSATTPATTVTANPSISVNSSGLITATASATKSVTPTVSAGYVSSGTAGTITVSGSNTSQLTTQAAQTIHPSSSDQTITSGKYLTGTQTIKGVTTTNLSAGNIKSGVTVEIGDSTDSDCVTSVTGTYTGGATYTITITESNLASVGQGYIQLNASGTRYYSQGDTITFTEGDTLKIQGDALANICRLYIDGVSTASGYPLTYTYTLPTHDIEIRFVFGASSNIYVEFPTIPITQNGKTNVNGYYYADVNVPTGGGVEEKQVNFIDYDGTIVYSYTAQEAQALTALPANPTHTGLTAQGWNWTLAEIKAHLTSYTHSIVDVGQMYTTTSGATEIDVTLLPDSLSPTLHLLLDNATVEVDWGDSSARDTVTGNATIDQSHTYSTQGTYTIKIYLISGQIRLYCYNQDTSPFLLDTNFPSSNRYTNGITAVRIGSGDIQLDQYSFNYLLNLEYVTIPNTINSLLGGYVFCGCDKLKSVAIPRCVDALGQRFFYSCYLLKHVCISGNIKTINSYPFLYTYNLKHVCLPDSITTITNYTFNEAYIEITNIPSQATLSGSMFRQARALVTVDGLQNMTSLGTYMFYACHSLRGLVIPNVTSIPNYAFSDAYCAFEEVVVPSTVTSIGQYAFQNIYTLRKITLPSGLATINTYAFSGCNTLLEIHMLSTTPPTLSGTGWFPSCATIYVPYSSDHSVLNTYKTAQNWSNFQSMIAEESP